ncbi:MAG: hypothetical protein ACR2OG_04170 [Gemmatimonadaceae bacterium]
MIDLESANRVFELYAGRPLTRLTDLPGVILRPGTQSQAVDCPEGAIELNSACRVRGDALWVQFTKVRASDVPGELLVTVGVLWTSRMKGTSYLTGYNATFALRRANGGWIARFLWAAVG